MRPFKIGIIADCFRLGPRAGVKRAKNLGADGVQIWAVSGEMSPERMTRSDRQEFRKFCQGLGIEISALCGDLGGHGFQLAERNPLKVARSMRIVDLAVDLGTSVVTTHIGVIPDDPSSETYRAMVEACRELGEYAEKKGVTFAIETGPEKATILRTFLDEVSTKGIGVNLDPANLIMVVADDPVEAVEALAPYIVHTHAKDGVQLAPCDPAEVYGAFAEGGVEGLDMGKLFSEVRLGRGAVDWDAYLDALEKTGYSGYLTIEREVGDDPGADIEEAVGFLKNKLGRPDDSATARGSKRSARKGAAKPPLRVGIVGLGFMGKTHFGSYSTIRDAEVVALADVDKAKREGGFLQSSGNIGTSGGVHTDLSGMKLYDEAEKMFADPDVDVVDITLPTFLHAEYAIKALKAGKHVICEKPMAADSKAAAQMVAAAKKAKRKLFVAHCIRFWPSYVAARDIVKSKKYGKLISATFNRLSATPLWSWKNWLQDEKRSGLAALDLHIHDADYVTYLMGTPKSVTSFIGGFKKGRADHIITSYEYAPGQLVVAEGAWEYASTFGFTAYFRIAMEKATLEMRAGSGEVVLHPLDGEPVEVEIPEADAYVAELEHFIDCIRSGKASPVVSPESAMASVKLVEAEVKSAATRKPVKVSS